MNYPRPLRKAATLGLALAATGLLFSASAVSALAGPSAPPAPPIEDEFLLYDYFDLQYIYTNFDNLDNGHGAGLNLSKGLFGNVYFTGSTDWTSTSYSGSNIDFYGATGGLGYAIPISSRFHLNVEGGAAYSDFSGSPYSGSGWGYFVGPGFRYSISQGMEFFANVYYTSYGSGNDLFEAKVGLIANITETLAFKLGGLLNEDDQSVLVGIRVYY